MAEGVAATGREIIARGIHTGILAVFAVAAFAYVMDFSILHLRIAFNGSPYGEVTVRPIYAVPQKNRSTEFLLGEPAEQRCVHALFPHSSNSPCWYLERHKQQLINI